MFRQYYVRSYFVIGICVTLLQGGCPAISPGGLTPSGMNGAWQFRADEGGQVCLNFNGGQLVHYSEFCDGTSDLVANADVSLSGNRFRVTFASFIEGSSTQQVSIKIDGEVVAEDRIEGTLTRSIGALSLEIRGRLERR